MAGAIILAGGESSRIGQNKALLDLGGNPLIEIIHTKLRQVFENIYIVTTYPEQFAFLDNVEFVEDYFPDQKHTLEAIYSGLKASKHSDNFVCACDMPYLNHNLINYLFEIKADYDVIVPVVNYKPVSFHTIFTKKCLNVIEKSFEKNNKKLKRVLPNLNVKYVPQEAFIDIDPQLLSFYHIKTLVDYMVVQRDF